MTIPQVSVFEEFALIPAEITAPLRAMIVGPEYELHRYDVAAEKTLAGVYSPTATSSFSWTSLGMAATSAVNPADTFTEVNLESANLEYYSGTGTVENTTSLALTINLETADGYTLASALNGRPVQVGDVVIVTGPSSTSSNVILTSSAQVTEIVGEYVAPVVSSATFNTSLATTAEDVTFTTSNVTNSVSINAATSITDSTYNGLASGVMKEIYTVTCTRSATGTVPSTAMFNITSASGTDNVQNYVPTATSFTTAIPIGTRGLNVLFTQTGSDTFLVGQTFIITVNGAFTEPTVTPGSTYTGSANTTYIVNVVTGGASPVYTVSTTNGTDSSGPVTVVASTVLPVGNYGLTIEFGTAIAMPKGGQIYIPVTAGGNVGAPNIVALNTSLAAFSTSSDAMTVQLAIQSNCQLFEYGSGGSATQNWTVSASGITINSGATSVNSAWHDSSGNLLAMPVLGGNIFVTFRALVPVHSNQIYSLPANTVLNTVFSTPVDPANPLVYAINKALLNSNGTGVRFVSVATDDINGYNTAIGLLSTSNAFYSVVPLTQDPTILEQFVGHVTSMSSPTYNFWRILWISAAVTNPAPIAETDINNNPLLGLFSGTGNTVVTSSNALFVSEGVAAGDLLYSFFGINAEGQATYQTFTVASVTSQTTLTLVAGPSVAPGVAQQIQVWRNLNATGLSSQIITSAGSYNGNSGRVYDVQPASISSGGVMVPGYFLAAALAGLKSGVAPHQPLTNLPINGFDNANPISSFFNRSQIEAMSSAGVYLVVNGSTAGASGVFTLLDCSTDTVDGLAQTLLPVVTNVDSIAYMLTQAINPYIGRSNIAPSTIAEIRNVVDTTLANLAGNPLPLIGPQVISYTINSVVQSTVAANKLVVSVTVVTPYELDGVDIYLYA